MREGKISYCRFGCKISPMICTYIGVWSINVRDHFTNTIGKWTFNFMNFYFVTVIPCKAHWLVRQDAQCNHPPIDYFLKPYIEKWIISGLSFIECYNRQLMIFLWDLLFSPVRSSAGVIIVYRIAFQLEIYSSMNFSFCVICMKIYIWVD